MTRFRLCIICGSLCAPGPRCDECRRLWTRQYDASRPAHHQLYSTAAWRKLSAEVRASAARCTWCLKPTRRLVADHVEPLDKRPDLALVRENLVAACVACNTRRGRNARLPDLQSQAPEPSSAAGAVLSGRAGQSLARPAPPSSSNIERSQ